MNYIAEIKAFHDLVEIKRLSTGQIALWYALMYINNKCAWIEWFTVPNRTLELHTGLSRDGIAKARNILKQKGMIAFETNGTKATSYRLNSLQSCLQDSLQNNLQGCLQDSLQNSTTLNKPNETKRNQTKKEKDTLTSTPKEKFVPPSVEAVRAYCLERKNQVDAQRFVDFYAVTGWYRGKNKMKDWKAAVRTWEQNRPAGNSNAVKEKASSNPFLDMLREEGYADD